MPDKEMDNYIAVLCFYTKQVAFYTKALAAYDLVELKPGFV